MKLNRILSLLLSVVLIFSALSGVSFAADGLETGEQAFVVPEEELAEPTEEVEVYEPKYSKESIGFLKALGIVEFDETTLGEQVKRADFLKMMSTIGGYGTDKTSTQLFADMPLDDAREPYVRALYNIGIISQDASGKIYPDAPIALQEAVAIAVKITGYSIVAESKGGYPAGYFNVAKQNGVLKGLPTNPLEPVTGDIAARLAENTLKADLMIQNFGANGGFYESNGKNLLNQVFKVYTYENVVTGVDISRVTGENDVKPFFMEIGGSEIEASEITDAHSWLGFRVIAYYTDDKGDIPRLKYLEKSTKNNETVIAFDDIVSFSDGKIKAYDENGKYKYYSAKASLPFIYNGVAANVGFSQDVINSLNTADKNGYIRLIDNTGDNTPDIIIADIYQSFLVSYADSRNKKIYDKYDPSININLDVESDDDYAVIYDAKGKMIDISSITPGVVAAVYDSYPYTAYQNKKIVRIVKNTVTGTIESLKKGGNSVVIGGTEYDIIAKCKAKFANIMKPGANVTLTLDANNEVLWVESGKNAFTYGFISAIHIEGSGSLSGGMVLKMFTPAGRLDIYAVADTLTIDGHKYDTASETALIQARLNAASKEIASGSTNVSSTVRFLTNADFEITCIDTLLQKGASKTTYTAADRAYAELGSTTADDLLFIEKADERFFNWNMMLGTGTIVSSNAMVLSHPNVLGTDLQVEKEYSYDKQNFILRNETFYNGEGSNPLAYALFDDPTEYASEFICVNGGGAAVGEISINTPGYIFDSINTVYDEENDKAVDVMTLTGKGTKLELKIPEGATNINKYGGGTVALSSLKKGDLVMVSSGSKGEISTLDLMYSPADEIAYGAPTAINGNLRIAYGYVYDKFPGGVVVYETGTETDFHDPNYVFTPSGTKKIIKFKDDRADAPVYSYTTFRGTDKTIESIDGDKLRTYKDVGADCSRVLIYYYLSSPRTIYEIEI